MKKKKCQEIQNLNESVHAVSVLCPVCGSNKRAILFEAARREPAILNVKAFYVRCYECGMIYLYPVPRWEEFKHYYEQLSDFYTHQDKLSVTPLLEKKGPAGWLYRQVFRFRPHSWPLEVGNGRKLLDVGCGNGARLIEFAARGWRIVGTDVSPTTLTVAQGTVPSGTFLEGELEDIDLPAGSFDVIRLDNVLEHIPEPKSLLGRCRELMNSRGRLYIYVPHGRSLSVRLLGNHSRCAWAPFHLHLFTGSALKQTLLDVGFGSVDVLHYSPHSYVPASLKLLFGITERTPLPYLIDRLLMLVCLPVGWFAERIGWGEELVAIAHK